MSDEVGDGLLAKLKEQDSETIAKRVQDVDQLEPDEHDRLSRAADFGVERHWKTKVKPCLNWIYFVVICIAIILLLLISISYLWDIHNDTSQKLTLLQKLFDLMLISGSTLFLEHKFSKKS